MALIYIRGKNKANQPISKIVYSKNTGFSHKGSEYKSLEVKVFRYTHKDPVLPPTLLSLNGEKYLMPQWKKVHPKTQLSDINWVKPHKKKKKIEKFNFESSSSGKIYTAKKITTAEGKVSFTCTCPGFYRVKDKNKGCKHVQKIIK